MKRIFAVLCLSLALAGCATVQGLQEKLDKVVNIGAQVTQPFDNPVTPERLALVETGMTAVFVALNAYRDTCENGTLPASCVQVIRSIQEYTINLPTLLGQLRVYVKANRQTDALKTYNQVVSLIRSARGKAQANGITIPGGV